MPPVALFSLMIGIIEIAAIACLDGGGSACMATAVLLAGFGVGVSVARGAA